MSTFASASNSCLPKQCQLETRSGCAAPRRMPSGHPSACQSLACHCGLSPALSSSSARRRISARRAWHVAAPSAQLGQGYGGMSRDLLDCWPGCSRASWIEGGAAVSLSGHGSASAGGGPGGLTVSAAALAESPAESAETAAPEPESAGNSIVRICSPEEFEDQLTSHGTDLIVLMCKAHSCRPCKMFTRKFQRIAEAYPDVTFLEIFGDDTKETRKLMISMSIRVTPNFRLYRNGELVDQLSGINETNLRNAVEKALHPEQSREKEEAATP